MSALSPNRSLTGLLDVLPAIRKQREGPRNFRIADHTSANRLEAPAVGRIVNHE
jgi:hypothetical protein